MKRYWLTAVVLSCLLCSCGGSDYTYVDTNEKKAGPGIFSGEDGVFTVVKTAPETETKEQKQAAESTPP